MKHKPSNLSIAASCEAISYSLRKRSSDETDGCHGAWTGQSSPLLMSPKRSPPGYPADAHPNKSKFALHFVILYIFCIIFILFEENKGFFLHYTCKYHFVKLTFKNHIIMF